MKPVGKVTKEKVPSDSGVTAGFALEVTNCSIVYLEVSGVHCSVIIPCYKVISLIIGHGKFRKHLHTLGLTSRCRLCDQLEETVEHIWDCGGYYTIVAPRVIRPNTEYHVAVSTVNVGQPTTVKVDVGGKQDSGGTFKISQFITVSPYENRILKLDIGDVGPGQYNITAQGSGGLDFYNSTALQYIHKSYSVFIQTDKAIYKPGHKVQFRALVLNSHLKPSVTAPLDIYITKLFTSCKMEACVNDGFRRCLELGRSISRRIANQRLLYNPLAAR
ncbi:hypothetical protein J6590_049455 [Homalodisca vitripennis]|nr:hypothetical protein J6590_049455 [Homalodisca vitripennis]